MKQKQKVKMIDYKKLVELLSRFLCKRIIYLFLRKNLYLKNNYKKLQEVLKNRKIIYLNYKFKQKKKNEIEQSIYF
jgi:hypothetical protein